MSIRSRTYQMRTRFGGARVLETAAAWRVSVRGNFARSPNQDVARRSARLSRATDQCNSLSDGDAPPRPPPRPLPATLAADRARDSATRLYRTRRSERAAGLARPLLPPATASSSRSLTGRCRHGRRQGRRDVCRVQQAHHLRPQHREECDARAADFGGFIAVGCACRSCSAVPGMLRAPSARPGRT